MATNRSSDEPVEALVSITLAGAGLGAHLAWHTVKFIATTAVPVVAKGAVAAAPVVAKGIVAAVPVVAKGAAIAAPVLAKGTIAAAPVVTKGAIIAAPHAATTATTAVALKAAAITAGAVCGGAIAYTLAKKFGSSIVKQVVNVVNTGDSVYHAYTDT